MNQLIKMNLKRYNLFFLLCFVAMFSFKICFAQTEYYIDSINGKDANPGTIDSPFNSVTKLNSMTLAPGTNVYLRSGCSWTGQKLMFSGSGTNGNPIVINKYDTGSTPLLAGNGITGDAVVYLYNQQYIEINNLEITNCPDGANSGDFFVGLYQNGTNPLGADRRGVMVALDNYGTANHIYLKNLYIHHIKGQLGSGSSAENGAIPKRTGGIYFDVLGITEKSSSKSRFNDILIDSCTISYCENLGLAFDNDWNTYYPASTDYKNWFERRYTNVKVSNNTLSYIGKNAMIIRCTDSTGVIEHNVCFETAKGTTGNTIFSSKARGTVFQYNEGYYNRANTQLVDPGTIDGSMYDADLGSINIIFQFSYSHDNCKGLYWGCNSKTLPGSTIPNAPDPADTGCTARYNISQNDLGDLVYFNYPSAGNHIYNNVFFIKSGLSPNIIHENSTSNHTYDFKNNIIFNLSKANSQGAQYVFVDTGSSVQNRTIDYNLFYGNHPSTEPADANKLTSNPMFVDAGSGSIGIGTVNGYKVAEGSPCIGTGVTIPNSCTTDYWGDPVPALAGKAPSRGAYEFPSATPVTLISFKGDVIANANQLNWTTIDEINNAGFEIQHSIDGQTFNNETFVPTKTSTSNYMGTINYSYTDTKPNQGANYYRLNQIDKTGQQTYSAVIEIINNKSTIETAIAYISIYPNPVESKVINIVFNNQPAEVYQVKLIDVQGKIVATKQINHSGGFSVTPFDVSSSTVKGIYFLKIVSSEGETTKLVMIK